MTSPDLIVIAFGAFSLLRLASYFPQIVSVARDRHGATAISFSCWSIWIGANASTALYAWTQVDDVNLALVSAFQALCCAAVLALAGYKRLTSRRPVSAHRSPDPCRRPYGRDQLTRILHNGGEIR